MSIAIPSSLVSEVPHTRDKTAVVGRIARSAALFRVDNIYIYRDNPDESNFIRLILTYIETPQYLRKRLFKKRSELRYVGVLNPLRTPHHPLEKKASMLRKGDYREGVVVSEEEWFLVDVGVEKLLKAEGRAPSIGGRATVQVTEVGPELKGKFVSRRSIGEYWGYEVHKIKEGLGGLSLEKRFDFKLATSRHAPYYSKVEGQLRIKWAESSNILVVFGAPRRGVGEILDEENLSLSETYDFAVNMIPHQGCLTVRTEEAVQATLAILNLLGR